MLRLTDVRGRKALDIAAIPLHSHYADVEKRFGRENVDSVHFSQGRNSLTNSCIHLWFRAFKWSESQIASESRMQRSDEELMLSCRDGDEGAFEILYRRYEKSIFSFVYRMVTRAADAEDLCQETFLQVVRAKKKYQATATFKTWLFQIALNLCRDRARRMKFRSHLSLNFLASSSDRSDERRQESICDPSSDPVERVQKNEMKRLVQQALAALPEDQRAVVLLREYHALRLCEIAEIMQCPLGTVKSLNYRGHGKLLENLSKYVD